jgi:hypothetical protein
MNINNTSAPAALLFAITVVCGAASAQGGCPCQAADRWRQTDRSSKADSADRLQARRNGQGHQALGR